MINDDILADKLNLYREGKLEETPEGDMYEENDSHISNFLVLLFKAIDVGAMFLRSLAFGFAAKTIFSTNWIFIEFLTIGFVTEIILTNTFNLFKQKNK